MIVLSSHNGRIGLAAAMEALQAGRSAVDAVECGIRMVESNPADHSVGVGGYPNLLGEVELDAGIMDGRDRSAGAVGALQGFPHPVSVARLVMQKLPHTMLVGAGAQRFAAEMGVERGELRTEEAMSVWRKRLLQGVSEERLEHLAEELALSSLVSFATDPKRARGTVNMLALDGDGQLAVAVSTSGWAWKYPGRLGDSPVIGAGLYADSRFGAATCTGMGEMAIRAGTTRCLVLHLQQGASLETAARLAMEDLDALGGSYLSQLNFLLLTPDGQHAGFGNAPDIPYVYLTDEMDEPAERERGVIPTHMCWGENNE